MDLNSIKMFIVIAQAGTFAGGSQRIGVPIATLSRKIKELEQDIGVQLFERSTQGVRLTLTGQQLYEQANFSIETLDEIERRIKHNESRLKGKLRLSMPQSFELWWTLLDDFTRAYPDIALEVVGSNRKIDLLEEGIDVALRVGDLQTEALIAKKITDVRLMLVASPEWLARFGMPAAPQDLAALPCAGWMSGSGQTLRWQLGAHPQRITPQFGSNDYQHLRHLALQGKAVCDLPDFLARPLIEAGKLVAVLPDYPFPAQPVHLLYPSHRHPSSIVRVYLDFCAQWFKPPG
ncbi:LysR family transcriptional regulator [Testudinibacter sp. TR-2022]|uniref:LysR family transcriptional regulator n=1 Tax=Testudinibacter sp. TR-2022 TaxID=2585029 RepID=UPI001118A718|nr:LysR family transcriptional regulator [Testudinibacter sp. TR-2022]TNH04367.1 LysR family transcriptional regulator [Pasteurellaceae bacterium Phil11]TNH23172.1 LysR family transcriptional regulator [Testudinibacter sp. TR-2022]TNH23652.1 LysR family transcriptional regulator [Testudinibacter sp. TR-2022]